MMPVSGYPAGSIIFQDQSVKISAEFPVFKIPAAGKIIFHSGTVNGRLALPVHIDHFIPFEVKQAATIRLAIKIQAHKLSAPFRFKSHIIMIIICAKSPVPPGMEIPNIFVQGVFKLINVDLVIKCKYLLPCVIYNFDTGILIERHGKIAVIPAG